MGSSPQRKPGAAQSLREYLRERLADPEVQDRILARVLGCKGQSAERGESRRGNRRKPICIKALTKAAGAA